MPVSGPTLAALIQTNVDSRMAVIRGIHPLQQKIPAYYIEMCNAIGNGLVMGAPAINFQTSDTGFMGTPPIPGIGAGVGIITDPTFFIQDLYSRVIEYVKDDFGRTLHEPFPPSPGNSGEFLQALCQGINDSFLSYYPTAWALASTHPLIYAGSGIIADGQFTGLVAPTIQADIIAGAPNFIGKFWPRLCQAIAESYVALIEQHSTGTITITGVCVPGPSQVCGVPGSGAGSGVAT